MFNREEDSTIGTSLIAFLLGCAVGATVAILYAPAAGSETRAQIAEKAGEIKDQVAEKAEHLREQVSEKAGHLREQVSQKAVHLKERAAHVMHRVGTEAASELESAAESARRMADTVQAEAGGSGGPAAA